MPYEDIRRKKKEDHQEKERLLFFPGKGSAKKNHGLFFTTAHPTSFSSLQTCYPFLALQRLADGLPCLQISNWNSLLILNKSIIAKEIPSMLFASGQQWQYAPFQCISLHLFLLSSLLYRCSLCLQERKNKKQEIRK